MFILKYRSLRARYVLGMLKKRIQVRGLELKATAVSDARARTAVPFVNI